MEEDDRPLDEDEILCVTKARCLDRVRVLSVPASGYTSINTGDLAKCINLRELDLSENALRVFPRRLHLPQLTKLSITGNRFIHLPLFEQFPKLIRLNLDDKLKQVCLVFILCNMYLNCQNKHLYTNYKYGTTTSTT